MTQPKHFTQSTSLNNIGYVEQPPQLLQLNSVSAQNQAYQQPLLLPQQLPVQQQQQQQQFYTVTQPQQTVQVPQQPSTPVLQEGNIVQHVPQQLLTLAQVPQQQLSYPVQTSPPAEQVIYRIPQQSPEQHQVTFSPQLQEIQSNLELQQQKQPEEGVAYAPLGTNGFSSITIRTSKGSSTSLSLY